MSGGQIRLIAPGVAIIHVEHDELDFEPIISPDCQLDALIGDPRPICPVKCVATQFPVFEEISVRVDFKIDSIEPDRCLIGADVDVTIKGDGFGTSGTLNTGANIEATDVHFTPREIFAVFKIKSAAAGGNHSIKVTIAGKEHSVDFFVQIPTSLQQDSISPITVVDPGPGPIGDVPNACGAYRKIVYAVLDQGNPKQTIRGSISVTETVVSITDSGRQPFVLTQNTDENGRIEDLLALFRVHPICPGNGQSESVRQTFSAKVAGRDFMLTTVKRIEYAKSSTGSYSINVVTENP